MYLPLMVERACRGMGRSHPRPHLPAHRSKCWLPLGTRRDLRYSNRLFDAARRWLVEAVLLAATRTAFGSVPTERTKILPRTFLGLPAETEMNEMECGKKTEWTNRFVESLDCALVSLCPQPATPGTANNEFHYGLHWAGSHRGREVSGWGSRRFEEPRAVRADQAEAGSTGDENRFIRKTGTAEQPAIYSSPVKMRVLDTEAVVSTEGSFIPHRAGTVYYGGIYCTVASASPAGQSSSYHSNLRRLYMMLSWYSPSQKTCFRARPSWVNPSDSSTPRGASLSGRVFA